jgi:hypothetical protein
MDVGRSRSSMLPRNQNESPQHAGVVAFSDVCRVLVLSFVDLDARSGLFMFEKSQGRLAHITFKKRKNSQYHQASVELAHFHI